ncbi:hypothetical protein ACIBHX_46820 [Nonomuraea sp. NPDC050536]|uniref:hypothetical protein n=1 Tax=Nonomuraea sp. NPDC050536 TaxID=3364366 RepID=UPI0037C5F792
MAGACWWAWQVGWIWSRLRNLALPATLMPITAMAASWSPAAPLRAFAGAIERAQIGDWLGGLIDAGVLTIPAGLWAATAFWARQQWLYENGQARTLAASERHLDRRWEHRLKALARLSGYRTPLTTADGDLVLGPLAEESSSVPRGYLHQLMRPHRSHLIVPALAPRHPMVVVGDSGAGKTELLRRMSAAIAEAGWERHARGERGRPLIIFVDAKGGQDAEVDGATWCDTIASLGIPIERIGLWPLEVRLDMWQMEPRDLTETLHLMAKTDQRYYAQLQKVLLHLVIDAPSGPPRSSLEFLTRLKASWLRMDWAGHSIEQDMINNVMRGKEPTLPTNLMLYASLFRDLGVAFDAGRPLMDFDALYCVVQGTRRPEEAHARAAALIQILTDAIATQQRTFRREVTLIFEEFSAVSDIPLYLLSERFRSLGCSVIPSAQSWDGLGPNEPAIRRLVNTSSGGRLLMRSPDPEQIALRAGTMRRVESSRHIGTSRGRRADAFDPLGELEGSQRIQDTFVVDPQKVRRFQPGEVVYSKDGRAWWGRVVPVPAPPRLAPSAKLAAALTTTQHPALTGNRIPFGELAPGIDDALDQALRGWS